MGLNMNFKSKGKKYRHILIFVIFTILAGILYSIIYSQIHLIIRNYDINSKDYSEDSKRDSPICLVALSDLHGRMIGKDQSSLVSKIKEQNPDLIVFLGDMIDKVEEPDCNALIVLTKKLCRIAPVYWVEGNHEPGLDIASTEFPKDQLLLYDRMKDDMAAAGAVLLSKNYKTISIEGRKVNLCGIRTHYYWGEKEAVILNNFKKLPGIHILLCHYPESVIWYKPFEGGGLDLALCGHTHGGLIRVPFKGGLYAPEWGWWPMYDLGAFPIYDDTGWHEYGGKDDTEPMGTMIISSGLDGEHGVPRVNNPAEITVVHIY